MSKKSDDIHSNPAPTEAAPATEGTAAASTELEQLKAQAADNWDKFLRVTADLDNYRKRVIREREEVARTSRESLISALLPAIDNLERALEHSPGGTPLHDGLLQVQKQFARSLAEFGLVELVVKPGEVFDANVHEAVSQTESDQPEGVVVQQLQSGYKVGERLIRPARVVVSKGPAGQS